MPRMLPVLLLLLGANLVAFGQADMPKPPTISLCLAKTESTLQKALHHLKFPRRPPCIC